MGVATEVKNMSAQWRIPPLPLPQSLYKGTVYKLFGTHTFNSSIILCLDLNKNVHSNKSEEYIPLNIRWIIVVWFMNIHVQTK